MRNRQMSQEPPLNNKPTAVLLVVWLAVLFISFFLIYLDDELSRSDEYGKILVALAALIILAVLILVVFAFIGKKPKTSEKIITKPGTYFILVEAEEPEEEEIVGKDVRES